MVDPWSTSTVCQCTWFDLIANGVSAVTVRRCTSSIWLAIDATEFGHVLSEQNALVHVFVFLVETFGFLVNLDMSQRRNSWSRLV